MGHRVVVPVSVGAPDAELLLDDPPPPAPAPQAPPPGLPSSSCEETTGGTHVPIVNADLASDTHVWASAHQPDAQRLKLCARVEGAVNAGGSLGLDATQLPGGITAVQAGSDLTPCTVPVLVNEDPVEVEVWRTPLLANPASVCVKVDSVERSFTVDTNGTLVPPVVAWSPDPGTPG